MSIISIYCIYILTVHIWNGNCNIKKDLSVNVSPCIQILFAVWTTRVHICAKLNKEKKWTYFISTCLYYTLQIRIFLVQIFFRAISIIGLYVYRYAFTFAAPYRWKYGRSYDITGERDLLVKMKLNWTTTIRKPVNTLFLWN